MNKCIYIVFISLLLFSCENKKKSETELLSEDFPVKEERIEKLKEEVVFFSDVKDAEFRLINANGFHNQRISVPGASSHDYKFAVKIDPYDVPKWTKGMKDTTAINYLERWLKGLTGLRKEHWIISKEVSPKFFVRTGENVEMMVFEKEGIVFKWSINL